MAGNNLPDGRLAAQRVLLVRRVRVVIARVADVLYGRQVSMGHQRRCEVRVVSGVGHRYAVVALRGQSRELVRGQRADTRFAALRAVSGPQVRGTRARGGARRDARMVVTGRGGLRAGQRVEERIALVVLVSSLAEDSKSIAQPLAQQVLGAMCGRRGARACQVRLGQLYFAARTTAAGELNSQRIMAESFACCVLKARKRPTRRKGERRDTQSELVLIPCRCLM